MPEHTLAIAVGDGQFGRCERDLPVSGGGHDLDGGEPSIERCGGGSGGSD